MSPIVPENDDDKPKETRSVRLKPSMWAEIDRIAANKRHPMARVVELLLSWALEAHREEERQAAKRK